MLVESANHEYLRYCPGKIGGGTTHVPTHPPPKILHKSGHPSSIPIASIGYYKGFIQSFYDVINKVVLTSIEKFYLSNFAETIP